MFPFEALLLLNCHLSFTEIKRTKLENICIKVNCSEFKDEFHFYIVILIYEDI